MTQDTGQGIDWTRAFVGILGGAAAGISSAGNARAVMNGINTGMQIQQNFGDQDQRVIDNEQRERFNGLREQSLELDIQAKQKRLDTVDVSDTDRIIQNAYKMNQITGAARSRFKREFYSSTTARSAEVDAGMLYGLNEKEAKTIDDMSGYSQTKANLTGMFHLGKKYMTEGNPALKKRLLEGLTLMGMQDGIAIKKNEKTGEMGLHHKDHGWYRFNDKDAMELWDKVEADTTAGAEYLKSIRQTRVSAASGSEWHALKMFTGNKGKEALKLDMKTMGKMAGEFSKQIQNHPVMSRVMDLAHLADRRLKNKDPEHAGVEQKELLEKLKKGGVEFDGNKAKASSLNDYFNAFNSKDPVNVVGSKDPDAWVEVNEELIGKLFENSGLNQLSDSVYNKAKMVSDFYVKQQADEFKKTELAKDYDSRQKTRHRLF